MVRNRSACPHRVLHSIDQEEHYQCALVSHLLDGLIDDVPLASSVAPSVCDTCCQFPVPSLPDLNPVVASLVYSASTKLASNPHVRLEQQLLSRQVVEFGQQRLSHLEPIALESRSNEAGTEPPEQPLPEQPKPGPTVGRWIRVREFAGKMRGRFGGESHRIGLAGWNSRFGLGHLNRDMAQQLGVASWLSPISESSGEPLPQCELASRNISDRELAAWLRGLDVVVFAEQPPFKRLTQLAQRCRVPVVCIPNWEWIRPGLDWVANVDLMLCPTRHTFELLGRWKERFGFGWDLALVPWPINTERFRFRRREQCRRFVFIGGRGGFKALVLGKSNSTVRRKGLELLLQSAESLPDCRFLVFSEERRDRWPDNVCVRRFTGQNFQLYEQGDVCVQPSYWEGIGLPLLECQAAGLPLITTDAAPMNEYHPLATIPVRDTAMATLAGGQEIPIPLMDPADLTQVLASLNQRTIAEASQQACEFVNREHSWSTSAQRIRTLIDRLVGKHER